MKRRVRTVAVGAEAAATLLAVLPAAAESPVFADGRDDYSLLDPHPVNRQLFEQQAEKEQSFRLARDEQKVTFMGDFSIGTQQLLRATDTSRYHGFFLADTYTAARLVDGLDVNLNLLLLNPSASDGYRVSSQVYPGLALHAYDERIHLGGDPVRLDLLGTDLGWVTIGNGLLLEQTPVEGVMGGASWRDFAWRALYAGRVFWGNDDLIATSLSALGGRVELTFANWQQSMSSDGGTTPGEPDFFRYLGEDRTIHPTAYGTLSLRVPVGEHYRFAAEFASRFRQPTRGALLLRTDYRHRKLRLLRFHLGYQFRYYQAGFGPRDQFAPPSWIFNTPRAEDLYVTNSFEYWAFSSHFEQWSHTVMLEVQLRMIPYLEIFSDWELWDRQVNARPGLSGEWSYLGVIDPSGNTLEDYYRFGLRLLPWPTLPHRLSAYFTNKQVSSATRATNPVYSRFAEGKYLLLELEAFL